MRKDQTPILFPYSPDELWEKMRELLRVEIGKLHTGAQNVEYHVPGLTQKPIFKAEEVCKILDITRQTLHSWVKEGLLKQYKIKSRTFYLWSDIEKLLTQE